MNIPVLILKLEHYGSLGIIRSLGRWGIPVYGIDDNPRAPGFSSRYCRGRFLWDIDRTSPRASLNFLKQAARQLGKWSILIPTSDETAMFVSNYAEELKETFLFPDQPAKLTSSLCSKKKMYLLAKECGIPTAETLFPACVNDVLDVLPHITFPVMLKGIDGAQLERKTGKKMVIVNSKAELAEKYKQMEDPVHPNLMIQEFIPGGDDSVWMFNGYFNERSECLFGFTGKKIRQNPVYTGMTSLGICLRNGLVEETTKKFMKQIGYRGILDIGYRYDSRDNSYKVLDVNPRIGATFRLFVGQKGMDVVRALYLDLTGNPVPADTLQEGRKWIVEDKDLRSCIQYYKDGKLTFGEWIRSLKGIRETGYFALDDMLPFIAMGTSHLRKKIFRKNFSSASDWHGESSVDFGEVSMPRHARLQEREQRLSYEE